MIKRFVPYLGAIAASMVLFIGCQDSVSTGPDTEIPNSNISASDDALFSTYTLSDQIDPVTVYPETYDLGLEEIASSPMMPPDNDGRGPGYDTSHVRDPNKGRDTNNVRDPNKGRDTNNVRDPNKGSDTNNRRGPNDGGLLRPIPFIRILHQLDLSDRQWGAIRNCFSEYHECVKSATARYRNATHELRDGLHQAIRRLKAAVEAGDITPQEARALYHEILNGYREDAVELRRAYAAAIEHCKKELIDCIEGYLTPEQLREWRHLLEQTHNGGGRNG